MNIGIIPDPENHRDWEAIKALLEPAAKFGEREILRPLEMVWVVYDNELKGAAVASLKMDDTGEVSLVGGTDYRRWIKQLDWLICSWMRREGMSRVRAYGRKGWRKVLTDWEAMTLEDGQTAYEKVL